MRLEHGHLGSRLPHKLPSVPLGGYLGNNILGNSKEKTRFIRITCVSVPERLWAWGGGRGNILEKWKALSCYETQTNMSACSTLSHTVYVYASVPTRMCVTTFRCTATTRWSPISGDLERPSLHFIYSAVAFL